ncbi:hypothetical protein [Flavobacterium sp. HJSW_4]|uniref:hypothetical protein n=1 Tax=Flavobacterium sp. HJSW_4 TaxID=3344660 RepID=UPI0035F22BE3
MNLLSDLLDRQTVNGAFSSEVKMRGNLIIEDENVFITVLVVFELFRLKKKTEVTNAINRALDFIECCEEKPNSGIFKFYPEKLPSAKLNISLHGDLDDSALSILALVYFGRRDKEWANSILVDVFEKNRLLYTNAHPAWVRPGTFKTWISDSHDNPIDCCVNLNVLALYAYLGHTKADVYSKALESVMLGFRLTNLDPLHMRHLAPFYAHPSEVYEAIRRAANFGVVEMTNELNVFQYFESHRTDNAIRPVCCNGWGQPLWFSKALQIARTIELANSPTILLQKNIHFKESNHDY